MKIDVVVLAGGDASKVGSELNGPKSLIKICGRPMIDYVMDALGQCAVLGEIAIALPPGADQAAFTDFSGRIIPDTHGVIIAMLKATELFDDEGYLMAVSSDAPMISAQAIDDFVKRCESDPADLYYTIIPKTVCEMAFPGSKRTYFRLKEGAFTGGNVHMIKKSTFVNNLSLEEQIFAMRKKPISLIRMLGVSFVLKFARGRLSITSVEEKAGAAFHAEVRAIITTYPELGVDVDKPEDLELAEAFLKPSNGV